MELKQLTEKEYLEHQINAYREDLKDTLERRQQAKDTSLLDIHISVLQGKILALTDIQHKYHT